MFYSEKYTISVRATAGEFSLSIRQTIDGIIESATTPALDISTPGDEVRSALLALSVFTVSGIEYLVPCRNAHNILLSREERFGLVVYTLEFSKKCGWKERGSFYIDELSAELRC